MYTQVIFFSMVPGLAILSASEMHLKHLPRKTEHLPQPKVASLSPGPRGCPGDKDVVPDVMQETRWGLAPIPIPYLDEEVVPVSRCFLLILVPMPVSSIHTGAAV